MFEVPLWVKLLLAALFLGGVCFELDRQYTKGYDAGKSICEANQAIATIKHSQDTKRQYDKIQAALPNIGDKPSVDKFLLSHTH